MLDESAVRYAMQSITLAMIRQRAQRRPLSGQLFSVEAIICFFEPQILGNLSLKNSHERDCVLVSRAYFGPSHFF